eukprot:COSAG01_NODE_26396_length_715_cov_1.262987_1_plen_186_part_01
MAAVGPTSTAQLIALQQYSWEWRLVGMRLQLPGSVWGVYAQNAETKAWSRTHATTLFEIVVRNWAAHTQVWMVQHGREDPFHVRAEDLLQYVCGKDREHLLAMGAPIPAVPASKGRGKGRTAPRHATSAATSAASAAASASAGGDLKRRGGVAAVAAAAEVAQQPQPHPQRQRQRQHDAATHAPQL